MFSLLLVVISNISLIPQYYHNIEYKNHIDKAILYNLIKNPKPVHDEIYDNFKPQPTDKFLKFCFTVDIFFQSHKTDIPASLIFLAFFMCS